MSQISSKGTQSLKMLSILCVTAFLAKHTSIHRTCLLQGSIFNFQEWLPKHTAEYTGKRVRKLIDGLKAQDIAIYGATGFCYGGTTRMPVCGCHAHRSG